MPCHSKLNVLSYLQAMMLADNISEQMAVVFNANHRSMWYTVSSHNKSLRGTTYDTSRMYVCLTWNFYINIHKYLLNYMQSDKIMCNNL